MLYQQPILDLAHRRGHPARAAAAHGRRRTASLIAPATFLYIAERFGLIQAIDRWVVRQAIALIAGQRARRPAAALEVNLSGKSIDGPRADRARSSTSCARSGIDPDRPDLRDHRDGGDRQHGARPAASPSAIARAGLRVRARRLRRRLRLLLLPQAPAVRLPQDRRRLHPQPRRSPSTTSSSSRRWSRSRPGLGKQTIAEFVGDEPTLELLRAYGVDFAQGYDVGRPEPVSEWLGLEPAPGRPGRQRLVVSTRERGDSDDGRQAQVVLPAGARRRAAPAAQARRSAAPPSSRPSCARPSASCAGRARSCGGRARCWPRGCRRTSSETIAQARAEHLTYLKPDNLRELAVDRDRARARERPGLIVEAGTARGGSAIVLAAAKAAARPMKVYDVFGMIPPPGEHDGEDVHERYEKIAGGAARGVGGETYYGYRDDLYREVTESFSRLGVPVGGAQRRADPGAVRGHDRARRAGRVRAPGRRLVRVDDDVPGRGSRRCWSPAGGSCSTTTTSGRAAARRSTSTSPDRDGLPARAAGEAARHP